MKYFRFRNGFVDLSHVVYFEFDDKDRKIKLFTDICFLSIVINYKDDDDFYLIDKERLKNIFLGKCEDYYG